MSRLVNLRSAGIDASTIIYLLKAGFLGYLAAEVELRTVSAVMKETGWRGLPIRVDEGVGTSDRLTPDDRLLAFALAHRLPLISEDRKLLQRAGAAGLTYYNALLMLDLLVLRGRFSEEEYHIYRDRLVRIGRYDADVLATEKTVAAAVFAGRRHLESGFPSGADADRSTTK